jgi:Glycosyltransferase family 87
MTRCAVRLWAMLRPRGWRQMLGLVVFALLPTLIMISLLREAGLGWDFRAFYVGGRAYLSGASPYPGHSLAALANKQEFVYPAPMAALFVPLALLPYTLAVSIWLAASVAAIAVALRVLGVRDWRCLGALFLTQPVEQSVRLGTLMPVLMLLLALLWKYRDRVWTGATLVAIVAVSKLFLFPLLLWLAMTRRLKTAALGAAIATAICLVGWLPIPLSTIVSYPSLLRALAAYEETFSYSLTSLAVGLGVSAATATMLAVVAGVGLLLCATKARNDDFLAFRVVLAASFVLSPIVWGHYYVLLVVPLAVSRPKLSALWLTAIWIKPDTLQMRSSSAWVTLALLVLLAQLDLTSPLSRWWNRQPRPHLRQLTALSALTGLLAASAAGAEAGLTGTTALRPLSKRGLASGVASIRVDRAERQLCWRIWTHDLPARRAAITLRSTLATSTLLTVYTSIGHDGQAQGCAQVNRTFAQPTWTVGPRTRYRLGVTVPDAGFITGTIQLPNPRKPLPRRGRAAA